MERVLVQPHTKFRLINMHHVGEHTHICSSTQSDLGLTLEQHQCTTSKTALQDNQRTLETTCFMSYGTFESWGSRYRNDLSTRSRQSLVFRTGGFSGNILITAVRGGGRHVADIVRSEPSQNQSVGVLSVSVRSGLPVSHLYSLELSSTTSTGKSGEG